MLWLCLHGIEPLCDTRDGGSARQNRLVELPDSGRSRMPGMGRDEPVDDGSVRQRLSPANTRQ
jgi:hypothetical protein